MVDVLQFELRWLMNRKTEKDSNVASIRSMNSSTNNMSQFPWAIPIQNTEWSSVSLRKNKHKLRQFSLSFVYTLHLSIRLSNCSLTIGFDIDDHSRKGISLQFWSQFMLVMRQTWEIGDEQQRDFSSIRNLSHNSNAEWKPQSGWVDTSANREAESMPALEYIYIRLHIYI